MGEPDEFSGQRVTVMGLGRFGGGVGVTRFLVDRGADVLVTDLDDADRLAKSLAQIQDLIDDGRVTLRLGEHNVSDFTTCDLVVVNPAVKPGNRFVRAAEAAGIEVTTEMRLLVQRLPNRLRTIGVTGSAGKSTVTAMIGHVLGKVFDAAPLSAAPQGAGSTNLNSNSNPKVWVGGNIGVSLLPHLDDIGNDDWVVLELSSFMLDRLRADAHFSGWSPHIAVITNISPNHLDWHGTMAEYVAAKQVILDYQKGEEGDSCYGGRNAHGTLEPTHLESWLAVDEGIFMTSPPLKLRVPGTHNQVNARLCSLAVHDAIGGDEWDSWEGLEDYPGLPHRLQHVRNHEGVDYYNDSKCTTPEAAKLAIEAFVGGENEPVALVKGGGRVDESEPMYTRERASFLHLILGGKDKGSDMKPLAGLAARKCKAVYTIGALGDRIAGLVEAAGQVVSNETQRPNSCGGVSWPVETAKVARCGDLDQAMAVIKQRVKPGDVVLLSPACASWDQFENYEQRGERFIELVQRPTD